jgi:hypothetical protein
VAKPVTKKKAAKAKRKIGRNDPCPCGSGKKYKKCCLDKDHVWSSRELDDLMQKGYRFWEKRLNTKASEIWLDVWDRLKARFSPDMKSIGDAERIFSGEELLVNWCQDLEVVLGNAALDDGSFHLKRMDYCSEFCALFPKSASLILFNMKRAVAEGHFGMGDAAKGDRAFRKLIEDFPRNIWGYIGWGDMYLWPMNDQDSPDYEKAEKIYKMALGKGLEDEEGLEERLHEVKEAKKEGKKEEKEENKEKPVISTGKGNFPGKCQFCKQAFAKREMETHLDSCDQKKHVLKDRIEKAVPHKDGVFRILAEGFYKPDYWLYFDIRADATLFELDRFLRNIWLECCGHLSAFTIGKKTYLYQLVEQPHLWGPKPEEYGMDVELKDVLRPKLKFMHDYDFGTTTRLGLKVLSFREGGIEGEIVQLLARNDPPRIICDACGRRKATLICTECQWKREGWLCESCAREHECDKDMFLPVVNSPRVGMCGYDGNAWEDRPKTLEDDDLCPCGSGEEYINCCWIRDVLREKKEKARIPFEELEDAVKDRVFKSQGEMQKFADEMMEKSNREPDEDFLGLSPEQVHRLLSFPLEQNEDIVRIDTKLPSKVFEDAPVVGHALFFLSELAKVEPLKATAKGNLPLKFARLLFDEMDDSRFKKWVRFRSEENSPTVLTLRHVLGMAGWIRKEKKTFKLAKKGHGLLESGFSDRDFFHLLHIFTRKFNWGFNDLYPEFRIIQAGWLFSLFVLHKKANGFTEDAVISRAFIRAFPEIALEVDETYASAVEYITHCYSFRFLENFCEPFGFVTARREKKDGSFYSRLFVKTTPLFKKYFVWSTKY